MVFDIEIGDIIRSDDGTISICDVVSIVNTESKYKAKIIKQVEKKSLYSFLNFDVYGYEIDDFKKDIDIVISMDKPLEPGSRNNIFIKETNYSKNSSYMNHLFENARRYEFTNDLLLYSNDKTFNINYKKETLMKILKRAHNG